MEKYFLDATLKIKKILTQVSVGDFFDVGDHFRINISNEVDRRNDFRITDKTTASTYVFGTQFSDDACQVLEGISCLCCINNNGISEELHLYYSEVYKAFSYDYLKSVLFLGEENYIHTVWSCSSGQIINIWTMYKNFDVFYLKAFDHERMIQKNPGGGRKSTNKAVPVNLYPLKLIRDQEVLLNYQYKVEWYLPNISTICETVATKCLNSLDDFSEYIKTGPELVRVERDSLA